MIEGELDASPILDPFGSGGVGAGPWRDSAGQYRHIGDAHGMAARVARRVGIDSDETEHINLDARLLERLPPAGILDPLANLDEASGKGVGAGKRADAHGG